MKTLKDQVQYISRGSMVRRFHQHHQLVQDTDGRHSHGVSLLCALLSEGAPSVNLLLAALGHDLPEVVSGDVPAPTKRVMRPVFDLDVYEAKIAAYYGFDVTLEPAELRTLKLADGWAGMLACTRELAMGNRTIVWVYRKWWSWLTSDFGALSKVERDVLGAIDDLWRKAATEPDAGYEEMTGVDNEA